MLLTLDFTCRSHFGRGEDAVFHWEDMCFVSGSYPYTQHSSPVITDDVKLGSFWARSRRSVKTDAWLSFCSALRRRGTNFIVTRIICKTSVIIFWHLPNAIVTSPAASLIGRRRSVRRISRTHATVSSVWWMACLGGDNLERIGVHFWNGNTTQMSSIYLGRTLQKLLAAFRTFQHWFSPDGNRNRCTHAAVLSTPAWDATHTAGGRSLKGFHRANVGRYRPLVSHIHLHRFDTCPTLLSLSYVL